MQVLQDSSMQVEAMDQQDASNVLKISWKLKNRMQDKYSKKELVKDSAKMCKYYGRAHLM